MKSIIKYFPVLFVVVLLSISACNNDEKPLYKASDIFIQQLSFADTASRIYADSTIQLLLEVTLKDDTMTSRKFHFEASEGSFVLSGTKQAEVSASANGKAGVWWRPGRFTGPVSFSVYLTDLPQYLWDTTMTMFPSYPTGFYLSANPITVDGSGSETVTVKAWFSRNDNKGISMDLPFFYRTWQAGSSDTAIGNFTSNPYPKTNTTDEVTSYYSATQGFFDSTKVVYINAFMMIGTDTLKSTNTLDIHYN